MNFVIDRMHFKGHTDVWCHQHCDPNKLKELEEVECSSLTVTTNLLASSMIFVIVCMHFKGHTNVWCHQLKELEKVGSFLPLISI